MAYGPIQVFSVTLASSVTASSAIDLQKSYARISVAIPTMTSGTDVYLQGASTLAGTYRRINHPPNSVSSVVGPQFVSSSVTQAIVPFQHVNTRFIKIELSTAMTAAAATFDVVISD